MCVGGFKRVHRLELVGWELRMKTGREQGVYRRFMKRLYGIV